MNDPIEDQESGKRRLLAAIQQLDIPHLLGLPDDLSQLTAEPDYEALARELVPAIGLGEEFTDAFQDEPHVIADHLGALAKIIRWDCILRGEQQRRAVELRLRLKFPLWLHADRLADWASVIVDLISAAFKLYDYTLLSRVYQHWGVCLYVVGQTTSAEKALEVALSHAERIHNQELELLVRTERFNITAASLSLEQARNEGAALLKQAQQAHNAFIQGRIHLSLARAFSHKGLDPEMFTHAQQSLLCFLHEGSFEMAGQATELMLAALYRNNHSSPRHKMQLFAILETFANRSLNPYFQGAAAYLRALSDFYDSRYEDARRHLLESWLAYRAIHYHHARRIAIHHMLGLIYSYWGKVRAARFHLRKAASLYKSSGNTYWRISADHALAYIWVVQESWERAYHHLIRVHQMAETLSEGEVRAKLVQIIQADINEAEQRLNGRRSIQKPVGERLTARPPGKLPYPQSLAATP